MTWGGWADDLSGLWKYEYEVFEVTGEKKLITTGTIYLNTSLVRLTV